jgi:hypothetical protein
VTHMNSLLLAIGSLVAVDPVPILPLPIALFFQYPEDGGSEFLRNVINDQPDYTTSHPR